jgi:outer membrane protein TolC
MPEEKSVAELRQAIHALAQAIGLLPEIFIPQQAKTKGLEAQILSDLIKEVLAKTSPQ